jgi:hypothetical protein
MTVPIGWATAGALHRAALQEVWYGKAGDWLDIPGIVVRRHGRWWIPQWACELGAQMGWFGAPYGGQNETSGEWARVVRFISVDPETRYDAAFMTLVIAGREALQNYMVQEDAAHLEKVRASRQVCT